MRAMYHISCSYTAIFNIWVPRDQSLLIFALNLPLLCMSSRVLRVCNALETLWSYQSALRYQV